MNKFIGYILIVLFAFTACSDKRQEVKEEEPVDTIPVKIESEVSKFYGNYSKDKFIVDIDTNLINKYEAAKMRAMVWNFPAKIYEDSGIFYAEGIEEGINFDIDPDCSSKFFRYKLSLDSLSNYAEKSSNFSDSYYFSWSKLFDRSGKDFVAEEVRHRGRIDKAIITLNDFNLEFFPDGIDSIEILRFHPRDVFYERFYVELWVINNSRRPINEALVDLTVSEYESSSSKDAIDSKKYSNLNILPTGGIPARSFQIIKKSFRTKDFSTSSDFGLKYFDSEQTLKSIRFEDGEVMNLEKEI